LWEIRPQRKRALISRYNLEMDMGGDTTVREVTTELRTTLEDVTHTGMIPAITITIPANLIDMETITTINQDTTIFTKRDTCIVETVVIVAIAIKMEMTVL